jgi:hypothetical protein
MNRDVAKLVIGCATMVSVVGGSVFWLWCDSWNMGVWLSEVAAFFCYALAFLGLWVLLVAHAETGFVKVVGQPFYTLRRAALFFMIAYLLLMLRWWNVL